MHSGCIGARVAACGILFCASAIADANIRGVVRNAQTGERLERVSIRLVGQGRDLLTGSGGRFEFDHLPPGRYTLRAATVGFRIVEARVDIGEGEDQEVEFVLNPDTFYRTDRIEVRVDAFDLDTDAGATDFSMEGTELKNLASVLADDPLRSVQGIPGVASNDDFDDRFSIHGAPFRRIGLYLDDILLHEPFHTVQGEGPSGSLAVFNGDVVSSLSLQSEAYPARFADRTAGALDVQTREGSRTRVNVRATLSAADAGILAEGPLGSSHRGSWLVSARQSYLQYIMQRMSNDATMAFGFRDVQAGLSYDLGKRHNLKLTIIDGTSDFDRSYWRAQLGLNSSMLAGYRVTLANFRWRYAPAPTFLVSSHAAFLREKYADANRLTQPLAGGFYGEWIGNTNASWNWSASSRVDFGASVRRIRGSGYANYIYDPVAFVAVEGHRGNVLLAGGYSQYYWSGAGNRLHVSAGVRWDRTDANGTAVTSPQASIAFLPWRSGRVHFSWGNYAQFPDIQYSFSMYGNRRLLPERATHYAAGYEQQVGSRSRFRAEVYRRYDRDLLYRPYLEARLLGTTILGDDFRYPLANSMRGYAQGLSFFLQRRTANRVTGWLSYSLGYARMRDGVTGLRFAADQDQRHTVNVYVGYRLRPSVNLSTKWTYGSGFPIPGFFQKQGGTYFLSEARNTARMQGYQRTDVRINKERVFDRFKMTIYAEVVNVFNRPNYRFDSYDGHSGRTGEAYLSFSKMFPLLPAAGVVLAF